MSAGKFIKTYNFPCLRMFLNEIFIVRLYNFITRRSKIVSLATSRHLNKYVKAEYCKQKYFLFQISKLFTCLRFQKAFKTAAGCYFEPWTNVFRSLCTHVLFTDNSFDFWFYSSETFAKSFDYFAILSSRNEPFRNIRSLHEGLGWVYRERCVGLYAWV